jgi:hypothetical protein
MGRGSSRSVSGPGQLSARKSSRLSGINSGFNTTPTRPSFCTTASERVYSTRTVQQAAREPVRLALLDANGPTGTFSNEDGPLPW